jgi:hypothetical protein
MTYSKLKTLTLKVTSRENRGMFQVTDGKEVKSLKSSSKLEPGKVYELTKVYETQQKLVQSEEGKAKFSKVNVRTPNEFLDENVTPEENKLYKLKGVIVDVYKALYAPKESYNNSPKKRRTDGKKWSVNLTILSKTGGVEVGVMHPDVCEMFQLTGEETEEGGLPKISFPDDEKVFKLKFWNGRFWLQSYI